jgi:organic radical activating enzyme
VGEPLHLIIAGGNPLPQGIIIIVGEPFQARLSADIVGESLHLIIAGGNPLPQRE